MESSSDPRGSMEIQSDTGKLGDVNGDDALLLRLPVEVYLRVLDFVAYPELLSLSRCNKYFRNRTLKATARAAFSGPLTRLRTVLPRVDDLAWSVPEKVDWFETKLDSIRSLKVLCVKGNVFSVNSTKEKPKEVLAPDLEHLEVYVDSVSYRGAISMVDRPILVLLKGLLPLPRLKSLDLKSCPALIWRNLGFVLCPPAVSLPSVRAPLVSPVPLLETLKLELSAENFLGFLSTLENPADLPSLKRVDIRITRPRGYDPVDRAPLVQAMATRPTPRGSRLLCFSEVKIDVGGTDNSYPGFWGPGTSLATRQAAVLLGIAGSFGSLLHLLKDPSRTIPQTAIISAFSTSRSDVVPTEDVLVIADAIMADLCPTPDLDTEDRRLRRLAMLRALLGLLAVSEDDPTRLHQEKLGAVVWSSLLSRPGFFSLLITSLRQLGQQARACMALLRVMPDELLCASLFDPSHVACLGLPDLLGAINHFFYSESRATTQERQESSLGFIVSLLQAAPMPLRDQVLALRLSRLVKTGIELEVFDGPIHCLTAKLLQWLGTVEGMWPRLQPMVVAGVLDFVRLVSGIGPKDPLLKELLADEDAMAEGLQLMDRGFESLVTWRRYGFKSWSALLNLLQDGLFRQRVSGRYSDEDVTAVLLAATSPFEKLSVSETLACQVAGTGPVDYPRVMDLMLRCARAAKEGVHAGKGATVQLVTHAIFVLVQELARFDKHRVDEFRADLPAGYGLVDFLRSETGRSLLLLTVSFATDNAGPGRGFDRRFKESRGQVVQSLHDAIELAGFCVLDESPVDLTWLHRSFCALALKSCERLLPELRAYGTHDEPTACDRGLTAVAGLLLLLDLRPNESASLTECLRELATDQPAAARVLAKVLNTAFDQALDREKRVHQESSKDSGSCESVLALVRGARVVREGFVPSLIQNMEEIISGLPTNINDGEEDSEASATEGHDQGAEDEGEDEGEEEQLPAEGATVHESSQPKAKRPRQK